MTSQLVRRCLSVGTSSATNLRRCAGSCCVAHGVKLARRSLSTSPPARDSANTFQDGPFDPYNAIVTTISPSPSSSVTSCSTTDEAPLKGWTAAIKANICVRGSPTTCSSAMLQNFEPTFDATAVSLLRTAGAQLGCITNCDEFGMGSTNTHSIHGIVRNPASPALEQAQTWDPEEQRVAGGSSGGSAAAVRAGLARFALGSDTGGSVRLPAAYCGVVGLKPSYGMVSRWGLVSYADSLDTLGVMARTVEDVSAVYEVISKPDSRDPTSASVEARTAAAATAQGVLESLDSSTSSQPLKGLRVGVPKEYFPVELHPRVLPPFQRAVAALEALGAYVVQITLPSTPSALSAYYIISSAEASSNLARYDGVEYGFHKSRAPGHHAYAATRTQGFGDEVRKRILLGTFALTADAFDNFFLQASRIRAEVQRDFASALRIRNSSGQHDKPSARRDQGVDVIVHPSAVDTAPTLAAATREGGGAGAAEYVQDILTVPASLAGLPALAVPAGVASDDGWPVGVTLVSQWGCDELLLHVGKLLQTKLDA